MNNKLNNKLNQKQAEDLFNDILVGNVRKLGNFKIDKYSVTVYEDKPEGTTNQRTKAYYTRRKEAGVCVECGDDMEHYVKCKRCRIKNRVRRLNRLLKIANGVLNHVKKQDKK